MIDPDTAFAFYEQGTIYTLIVALCLVQIHLLVRMGFVLKGYVAGEDILTEPARGTKAFIPSSSLFSALVSTFMLVAASLTISLVWPVGVPFSIIWGIAHYFRSKNLALIKTADTIRGDFPPGANSCLKVPVDEYDDSNHGTLAGIPAGELSVFASGKGRSTI